MYLKCPCSHRAQGRRKIQREALRTLVSSCFSSVMWGGGCTVCHHRQLQQGCGSVTLRTECISLSHLFFIVSERTSQVCRGWWRDVTQDMQQNRGHRGKEATHTGTETNFCSGACLGMKTFLASDIHPPPGALLSFRKKEKVSFRTLCAAEEEHPWSMRFRPQGNTCSSSLAMAEPPPAAILQGFQPCWLLHRAVERWGGCNAQAWLKQEFPLFSYTISSLWVLTDSFGIRSSLSRKWVGRNPSYSQFCF